MKQVALIICLAAIGNSFFSQHGYWQQKVVYNMDIEMDVNAHQFSGKQEIVYTNNSPDKLNKVFFHLYYNAFQPGSMMDVRSRTIEDPDPRVDDRISKLTPNEIGYHKISSITDKKGNKLSHSVDGTIMEVKLNSTLNPGKSTKINIEFKSQIPIQIRRTGRDNSEGVAYSMTQWYPKLCEYDKEGWHSNPYIGREFHGIWGDFNVNISIDKDYMIGGTGTLQNAQEIGFGYEDPKKPIKQSNGGGKLTWEFSAKNVHDFAWAADKDFIHHTTQLNNGMTLHFIHKDDSLNQNWLDLESYAKKCFQYVNANYGEYPYENYSIIQGGDGGMEYPMCTLIAAGGSFKDLVSVTVHESVHSWFQGLLATNEAKYEWMDEGFCTFVQYETLNFLYERKVLNPVSRQYASYIRLANSDYQEPLSTHADFYKRNYVYGISAYNKGAVFLSQLGYIIGQDFLKKGMKEYFDLWKFKHPTPTDFKRVMEKISGLELDWYFEQFGETINTIDYGVVDLISTGGKSTITLKRIGDMPMPLDVCIKLKDGQVVWYNIPMRIMRGNKGIDLIGENVKYLTDWPWVYPEYEFEVDFSIDKIDEIIIDPSKRLADVKRENNTFKNSGKKEETIRFKSSY